MKDESNAPNRLELHQIHVKNKHEQSNEETNKSKAERNLIFVFETESAGDEAGVISICFDIGNASSLGQNFENGN